MTYVTDPIGDFLTRMRNAQKAGHADCRTARSRVLQELCELLKREGWLADVQVEGEAPKQELVVTFHPEKSSLTITRVSKPGRRVYSGSKELKPVLRGFGIAVITTSQGLLTDREAREKGVGGEVLCTIS